MTVLDYNNSHKHITGQNGVHLVREISPWSSQVLCIGLAQNLKPILSDDKYKHGCTIFKHLHDLRYDPIQFQIQYMDVTPSKFLNICMP